MVTKTSGRMVYYPCTGDRVKSGEGTVVPVVAGAAMRQGAVRTGNRTGSGHRRLPVFAKRSYNLHGVLGRNGRRVPRLEALEAVRAAYGPAWP